MLFVFVFVSFSFFSSLYLRYSWFWFWFSSLPFLSGLVFAAFSLDRFSFSPDPVVLQVAPF